VTAGKVCGFLSANGSGKTTTIRMLCGLVQPDGGGGTCLGLDILTDAPRICLQVGYMTQRFNFYEDLDFIAAVYELNDRREAVKAIVQRMVSRIGRTSRLASCRGLEATVGARRLRPAQAEAAVARSRPCRCGSQRPW
jgi:ABC-type multidrug transport system ATPase subunit